MTDTLSDGLPRRKQDHLEICLAGEISSGVRTGAERYRLVHQALPELDLAQIDLGSTFLERHLAAPLLISSMTGGTERSRQLNLVLAKAAQRTGIAMALGSLRAAIEDPALLPTYQVRGVAPDILLLANLGAVQLNYGIGSEECRWAVDSIGADALILHLNPLQEALQPEGQTDFRDLRTKIADVCHALSVPVVIKEVGHGISASVATALRDAGVAAIDIAGVGGTSWSRVEALRDARVAALAEPFRHWGIPTFEALVQAHAAVPDIPIIASGGVTNGVEAAKALALGASLVGCALPWLRAAAAGPDILAAKLDTMLGQLRLALFCCGAADLTALDTRCIEAKD